MFVLLPLELNCGFLAVLDQFTALQGRATSLSRAVITARFQAVEPWRQKVGSKVLLIIYSTTTSSLSLSNNGFVM